METSHFLTMIHSLINEKSIYEENELIRLGLSLPPACWGNAPWLTLDIYNVNKNRPKQTKQTKGLAMLFQFSRLFQELIVYVTFPWRQLHLIWLKQGVVFVVSSAKLHGYTSLESSIRLHTSWDFRLYKRRRILWGSLKWITRENYLRQRIPVPHYNFFKIYLKFARVLRRLFLSVVSVTRVVYFHVNVTCFAVWQPLSS